MHATRITFQLWGGELELVVLSRLYDRSIIVYNEANGLVHEQVFQEEASSQPNNPVSLLLKTRCKLDTFILSHLLSSWLNSVF